MEIILRFLLGNLNLWTPILAIILGVIVPLTQQGQRLTRTTSIFYWFLLLTIGLMGIQGFIAHAFFGEFTAHQIGWSNSPFQYEVAIANLSYGVLGIMAFVRRNYHFALATVIGFAIWFLGDGVGHIYQLVMLKDTAPFNAGTTLYTDLLLPIMGLILAFFVKKQDTNYR